MILIDAALDWYPINPSMSSREVLQSLLRELFVTLVRDIPGDVCELGCHTGTTSVFFKRALLEYAPEKKLHLYDSFDGLPDPTYKDNPQCGFRGHVTTQIEKVHETFAVAKLPLPAIHTGWFAEIPEEEYPDKVSFAFFDGDFYSSIMDSFKRIYHRLSPGAIVCVHDYNVDNWPGTKAACDEFFSDKPEKVVQLCGLLGGMVKS